MLEGQSRQSLAPDSFARAVACRASGLGAAKLRWNPRHHVLHSALSVVRKESLEQQQQQRQCNATQCDAVAAVDDAVRLWFAQRGSTHAMHPFLSLRPPQWRDLQEVVCRSNAASNTGTQCNDTCAGRVVRRLRSDKAVHSAFLMV